MWQMVLLLMYDIKMFFFIPLQYVSFHPCFL